MIIFFFVFLVSFSLAVLPLLVLLNLILILILNFMSSQKILNYGKNNYVEAVSRSMPRFWHDLSHDKKLSGNMGILYPVMWSEVLPGETVNVDIETLVRYQPMLAPVMDRMDVRYEAFFVRNELLWPNWPDFISPPKKDSISPAVPVVKPHSFISVLHGNGVYKGSLMDHLGLPIGDWSSMPDDGVSALPLAAYQKIFSDWYRDEDLDNTSEFKPLSDGLNSIDAVTSNLAYLRSRNWSLDYFTNAKPWPQKGDDVVIPVSGSAGGVVSLNPSIRGKMHSVDGSVIPDGQTITTGGGASTDPFVAASGHFLTYDPAGSLSVPVIDVVGGTVNELNDARVLQQFLNAESRGGTRYTEWMEEIFGVDSQDQRATRAEYFGSMKSPISVSEVLQTSATVSDSPQGNMAGHGIGVGHGGGLSHYCCEHGIVMVMMSIQPATNSYFQGIEPCWNRTDRFDYPVPMMAELGEQPILNREIYAPTSGPSGPITGVFGYLPIYSYWKQKLSRLAGDFRSDYLFWTFARLFGDAADYSRPVPLNSDFIAHVPTTRPFAVTDPDVDHLLVHCYFKMFVHRQLPVRVKPLI